jgi:hypothetical protein
MRPRHLILDPHATATGAHYCALDGHFLDEFGLSLAHEGLRRIVGRTEM